MSKILSGMMRGLRGILAAGAEPQRAQTQQPERNAETLGPLSDEGKSLWKSRLARALAHHQPYFDLMDDMKAEYLGPHDGQADSVTVIEGKPLNLIASYIHTLAPLLLVAEPWPMVTQRRKGEEYRAGAQRLEARLRDVLSQPGTYRHLARTMFDALFLTGFSVVGWLPTASQRLAQPKPEGKGDEREQQPVDIELARRNQVGEVYDEPFFRHIPVKHIRIDPDAQSLEEARWVGYVTSRPLREVQADDCDVTDGGLYHDTEDLRGGGSELDEEASSEAPHRHDRRIDLYTIYQPGRSAGEYELLVLAGPQKVEIRHDYITLGEIRGWPIRSLELHDVGRLWPASPEQFWRDQHDSLNEFLAEATVRARQAKNVIVVPPDGETQQKIANAKGNDIITSPDPSLVKQISIGGTTPDTWQAMSLMERLADKVSGVSDFQRGVAGPEDPKLATQMNFMAANTQSRLDLYQRAVNRWLRQTGEDLAALLLAHQWQEVPVKLSLGGGRHDFDTFSNRNTPGPISAYDFDIDISASIRTSPAVKAKRTQDTLSLLADPNIQAMAQQEGKSISVVAALEDHLEAIGQRDMSRYIRDLPDPTQIAAQQSQQASAENQQMMQTGEVLPIDPANNDHRVHVQVHGQASDQSAAVAEHQAMHYQAMAAGATQAAPQAQQTAGAPPAPTGRHAGPARPAQPSTRPAGEAAMAAQAVGV